MSLIYDLPVIEDIIEGVVDSIQESGVIDNIVFESGISTITSSNSLSVGDIIEIDGESYRVTEVGTLVAGMPFLIPAPIPGNQDLDYFKIKGDVTGQTTWKAFGPYFMDGHLMEVSKRLAERDQSVGNYKYKKYPLIVLLQDFDMTKNGVKVDGVLDFVIVDDTESEYNTKDRRENKFKTILDPLYSKFMQALENTLGIDVLSEEIDVSRKYYWGSDLNDKNIFADHLDAITISQVKIQVNLKC